jgi:hypothetical protein
MKLFLVLVLSLMALGTSNANAQNYNDGAGAAPCPSMYAWWTSVNAMGQEVQCVPDGYSWTGYSWRLV